MMDPNETLRLFRVAMQDARELAAGDSNDDEIEALQDALGYAEALDQWLSKGGFLPDDWLGLNLHLSVSRSGLVVVPEEDSDG